MLEISPLRNGTAKGPNTTRWSIIHLVVIEVSFTNAGDEVSNTDPPPDSRGEMQAM